MKQPAASTCRSIKVITGIVFAMNAGLYIAAICRPALVVGGIFVTVIVLGCWLFWTPVAYELANGELIVSFRIGRKRYGPVVECAAVAEPVRGAVRLCGNGGLFAGSGIFWNKRYGVFRAYVTRSRPADLVLVRTTDKRIFISPADVPGWLAAK